MKKIFFLFLVSFLFVENMYARCVICFGEMANGVVVTVCSVHESISCDGTGLPSNGKVVLNNVGLYLACMDFRLVEADPNIYVNINDNTAALDYNGEVIKIGSDKMEEFLKREKRLKTPQKEFSEKFIESLKSDDGKVSRKRIEAMAKEFNAKIIEVNSLPQKPLKKSQQKPDSQVPAIKREKIQIKENN
jgi:hypothetical protein